MAEEIAHIEDPGMGLELRPSQALVAADSPQTFIARTAEIADALMSIVREKNLIVRIGQKEYPQVEAWTLLGSMMGAFGQAVFPVTIWTHEFLEEGAKIGWEARVEAHTLDGKVVGAAEAMCTRKEGRWKSADDYAIRSMAQTRATSKALRQPLGFIMQLAGLNPTPAEEMPDEGARPAQTTQEAPGAARTPDTTQNRRITLARLQKGLEALAGRPGWSEAEVLAQAGATFAHPVVTFDDLSVDEMIDIIGAMGQHGGVRV